MAFKSLAEVEASFRRVEQRLDAMLEESRAYLEREQIALRDDSNRSGFGGGYPYFVWSYQFEKRVAYGSEIKLAAANVWYIEPAEEEEAQIIKVTAIAEIFQTGKHSRVKEIKDRTYLIEKFLHLKLEQVIMNCFVAAEQVLIKY
jgi:hypothetical protein